MKHLLIFLLAIAFCVNSYSQSDTTYQYLDKNWNVSSKDSAYYISATYPLNGLWVRKDVNLKTNLVERKGTFLDREIKKRDGYFVTLYESGKLKDSVLYENGKRKTGAYFYENGKTKALVTFTDGKVAEQKGWDENGKEISNYVFEKFAEFPGGPQGWKKYLERNLNIREATNSVPTGMYTVRVKFAVAKDGKLSNVQAVTVPPLCPNCGVEAVRVIQEGPAWVPAIQFGQPVIYQATQFITFQVANG